MGGITVDLKDFDMKFTAVADRQIPSAALHGAVVVAAMIIKDAILVEPKAPHKTGTLWRTQKIENPVASGNEINCECGFDADYAAYVHELGIDPPKDINWTEPGSGAKYLESKLAMFKEKYAERWALEIRQSGGG